MKSKGLALFLCSALILGLSGCGNVDQITVDKTKVPVNYTAEYFVTTDSNVSENGKLQYNNAYTVAIDEETNELSISSKTDEYWSNKQEGDNLLEGRQIITTLSKINYSDNVGVPNYVEQEFYITADESYYTKFTFEHDHDINAGLLKTKKYSENSETGFMEETYSLQLIKQYFDKDSLPFIISAFNEDDGVIKISSGNRDSLQAVKYEFMENEEITVKAGKFSCRVVRLRPNTDFSVNSAKIYIDSETGIPVKVVHDSSVMELSSPIKFN